MGIDIQIVQHLESLFQSERDRLRNADTPEQIRPKEKFKRTALKGIARLLYLDKKVKLSKAETFANSRKGFKTAESPGDKPKKEKRGKRR